MLRKGRFWVSLFCVVAAGLVLAALLTPRLNSRFFGQDPPPTKKCMMVDTVDAQEDRQYDQDHTLDDEEPEMALICQGDPGWPGHP